MPSRSYCTNCGAMVIVVFGLSVLERMTKTTLGRKL
jgi:hypothetical protein